MTQHDAKTAVRHIQRSVQTLKDLMFRHIQPPLSDDIYTQMHLVIDDLNNLEKQLSERKDAKPNCRPVTPEELAALRASSNVFAFRPAA